MKLTNQHLQIFSYNGVSEKSQQIAKSAKMRFSISEAGLFDLTSLNDHLPNLLSISSISSKRC